MQYPSHRQFVASPAAVLPEEAKAEINTARIVPRPRGAIRVRPRLVCDARSRGPLAFLMALLATFAGAPLQAQTPVAIGTGGFVYTADEHGDSLSAIDLATGRVTTVPISISPHNVQITGDGTRLLAVGEPAVKGHGHGGGAHASEKKNGRLLLFDADHLANGPTATIEVGAHPAHVVVDSTGRRAFVTNSGDNAVSIVDLVRGAVIGIIGTGRYPHGLRVSPDGREVYVANVEDGSLSIIDAGTLAEAARIPVGKAPVQVGFTPDGSRVYVSLRDENLVAVVDTASRAVIAKIGVGRNPIQLHTTVDGRFVYVANQGTDAKPADTVSVIDIASGKLIDTVRTGKGAHGVSVSDDGMFVFVSNIVDGAVSVIGTATRKVTATIAVGRGPNGITYRSKKD